MLTGLVILILAALNLGLGVLVLLRDPRRPSNRWFACFVLSVSIWSLALAILYLGPSDAARTLAAGRLAFSAASLLPFFFLAFAKHFPAPNRFPSRSVLVALGGLASAFSLLSFSPYLVVHVSVSSHSITTTYGPLHPGFAVYFISCLVASFVVLFNKFRRVSGMARLQIKYLGLGLILAIAGGTTTNLVIPILFKDSSFSGYGPLFVSVLIIFATHAIIRYRLMDIRLVISTGLSYVLAAIACLALFVLMLTSVTHLTGVRPGELRFGLELVLVALVAVSFGPLRARLQFYLDRYVHRTRYDFPQTIRESTRAIARLLNLEALTRYVADVTLRTFRPEAVALFVRDQSAASLRRVFASGTVSTSRLLHTERLATSHPIVTRLVHARSYLARDVTIDARADDRTSGYDPIGDLDADLMFPLFDGDDVAGLLAVGPKLSGDPYFAADVDLLTALTHQAEISIKNAGLYNQVLLAHEYVNNILATIDSGVVAVDATGSITLFNAAAERLTGLQLRKLGAVTVNALPANLSATLQRALADGLPRIQEESTLITAAGRLVPIVSSTSVLHQADARIVGAVIVFSDVTHLRELDAERRRAERLSSLGALTSGIAHEIKNPLVAIRTFAELLPERYADADFREGFSQVVIREITRIDDLIARLRGLGGPSAPPLATVDVREPLDETLALIRAQLEQRHLSLVRHYSDAPLPVLADPAQLKQLFLNLVLNAIDAMSEGGRLTIQLAEHVTGGTPTVVVDISDTGSGIPTSLLPRIFDPFVTSKPTGSGLGLAICRGITDAHGGTIRARNNEDGSGATISVELPLQSAVRAMAALRG